MNITLTSQLKADVHADILQLLSKPEPYSQRV